MSWGSSCSGEVHQLFRDDSEAFPVQKLQQSRIRLFKTVIRMIIKDT